VRVGTRKRSRMREALRLAAACLVTAIAALSVAMLPARAYGAGSTVKLGEGSGFCKTAVPGGASLGYNYRTYMHVAQLTTAGRDTLYRGRGRIRVCSRMLPGVFSVPNSLIGSSTTYGGSVPSLTLMQLTELWSERTSPAQSPPPDCSTAMRYRSTRTARQASRTCQGTSSRSVMGAMAMLLS
jgi:hypothetical protein